MLASPPRVRRSKFVRPGYRSRRVPRSIHRRTVACGDRVRSFSRGKYPQLDALGIETVTGDLRDSVAVAKACEGVDVVFHSAGVAGIWGAWDHFYGINTLGTHNIVAGCLRHGVSRLVYTSSPSVTFDGTDQNGIDESAPYPSRWLCHYPHTKALAEQHVLGSNSEGSLLTCSLRPHLIWGPRDQHLILAFLIGRPAASFCGLVTVRIWLTWCMSKTPQQLTFRQPTP